MTTRTNTETNTGTSPRINNGIAGAIIAGGEARRLGGGLKFLLPLGSGPVLAQVIARAARQASPLVLNCNSGDVRLRAFGLPLLADRLPGEGPLGGIITALSWAATQTDARHLLSIAADTPFFPADLAERLRAAAGDDPAVASSGGRRHGLFALWPLALAADLERLFADGERSVNRALDRLGAREVAFAVSPIDPFFNINTPEDLETARGIAAGGETGILKSGI